MTAHESDPVAYYATPGAVTDIAHYGDMLDGLPEGIAALCQVVRGVMVDLWDAERYGVELTEARTQDDRVRSATEMLARIQALDDSPLSVARSTDKRMGGNSRQFAVLLCALLRYQHIPARVRYGFAPYFGPELNYAHCLCEYWLAANGCWVAVDAQLDTLQRVIYHIAFDPLSVPPTAFISAGQAWQLCQTGQADPEQFGLIPAQIASGIGYVRAQLVRDFAALNKMETLPWDIWGILDKVGRDLTDADIALLDRVAVLTQDSAVDFGTVRTLYANDSRVRVPDTGPIEMPPSTRMIGRGPAHPVKRPTPATHRPKKREFLKK